MKKRALLNRLQRVEKFAVLNLILPDKEYASHNAYRVANIGRDSGQTLAKSYLDLLIRDAEVELDDNAEVQKYSSLDKRNEFLFEYDLEMPAVLTEYAQMARRKYEDCQELREMELYNVKGYLVRIGIEDNAIVLYRKHSAVNTFKASQSIWNFCNNRFKRVNKPMIRIDSSFDLMWVDSKLYVRNVKTLEAFSEVQECIRRDAKKCVDKIARMGIVNDWNVLLRYVETDVGIARKFAKLAKEVSVFEKLDRAILFNFVESHNSILKKLKIDTDSTKPRFHVASKEGCRALLNLLNDDYLTSQLTGCDYEVMMKDNLR